MFLPRNEIVSLTVEDLRLLILVCAATDADTVHSVFDEGPAARAAEWLRENSYLELVDMDGANGFSHYQSSEKGRLALLSCLEYLNLL